MAGVGSDVESELWNIFTFYTVHGNVLDPERMTPLSLHKLCRETGLFLAARARARAITQQDVVVACTAEIRATAAAQAESPKSGGNGGAGSPVARARRRRARHARRRCASAGS